MQESAAGRNKIDVLLSRIVVLEQSFSVQGNKGAGKNFWGMLQSSFVSSSADFLLASSMASRENCGRYLRTWGHNEFLMMVMARRMRLGFSKIYKRRSSAIRFVHDLIRFLALTRITDHAANDDR